MTDSSVAAQLAPVRIVMVGTTLPANIGSAARAMKTMGLSDLVLVSPRVFPSGDASAVASGAADLLEQARVVGTLLEAVSDCVHVIGTSARLRTIPWPRLDARSATRQALRHGTQGPVAIVFGREDRGLTNEELALCQQHLTIPTDDEYGVLNVAAAIQVICYELRMHALHSAQAPSLDRDSAHHLTLIARTEWDEAPVTQSQVDQLQQHVEATLIDIDFLDPDNPRQLPHRLRRLFARLQLDRVEYNLLRGVLGRVQALRRGDWPPASLEAKASSSSLGR